MSHKPNDFIHVEGASQHNLKNISIDIPLNHLIAITGPSGSGKSTLAHHILYAEGQRRYVETFSAYSRQFLERLDKPKVEKVEGIPPAIAVEAATVVKSSRSTVGTLTELASYFKLLFSIASIPECPLCTVPITPYEPHEIPKELQSRCKGNYFLVCFHPTLPSDLNGRPDALRQFLLKQGFSRLWQKGKLHRIEEEPIDVKDVFYIILDRVPADKLSSKRIVDSLTQAYEFGNGKLFIIEDSGDVHPFTNRRECAVCGFVPPERNQNLFSFNNPVGACPVCRGFGKIIDIDMELVIPDEGLSIEEGAIKPFRTKRRERHRLLQFCHQRGIPTDIPFHNLTDDHKRIIINGELGRRGHYRGFPGIRGFFEKLTRKSYKLHVRVFLSRYRTYLPCPQCHGNRFQLDSLLFKVNGKTIADYLNETLSGLLKEFSARWEGEEKDAALSSVLNQIRRRLRFLSDIGLGYLTPARESRTLSGGEVQRLHLTRILGSDLVNLLYILDEPTVGLHPRDHARLSELLRELVETGNTVIVVEHEPSVIRSCDLVLDLGPKGGEDGGNIIYFGPPDKLCSHKASITGKYITKAIRRPQKLKTLDLSSTKCIEVVGASKHNLKDINVRVPLGMLVCVTGVSGSGKSTLVEEIIYKGIRRKKGSVGERPGRFKDIRGTENLENVVFLDQHPVQKSPRSNLLTYINIFSTIRNIFARTPRAKELRLSPGHFSFNVPGGRCATCKGAGFKKIEMQFMADVVETCPSCKGKRYTGKVLLVKHRGLSIADIQDITVREALEVFKTSAAIKKPLVLTATLGLDYLKLGQPLDTLSGGEAQRLKLVRFLGLGLKNHLIVLDEPTTGLHPSEISKLLNVLKDLVKAGNTVLVVEHNLQFVAEADWVIDLGPEGGSEGGYVVASGPPESIAKVPNSYTGRFLTNAFSRVAGEKASRKSMDKTSCSLPHGPRSIIIKGARLHNLAIDYLEIPRDKLVIITGISGSGKSSLAFDLLFAEGQRRYLECLSAYVRQYFKIMEKADVDEILGLPPTVAIEQRIGKLDNRSTVGTVSEIYHFLRLLYSKIGQQYCPVCGSMMQPLEKEHLVRELKGLAGREITILAPLVISRKGVYRSLLTSLAKQGFTTARIDGEIIPLDHAPELNRFEEHTIELVLDCLDPGKVEECELEQRLSAGMRLGKECLVVLAGGKEINFSAEGYCYRCRRSSKPLDTRLFSFNSEYGACPICEGRGVTGSGTGRSHTGYHEEICRYCNGKRLNPQALAVKVAGLSIDIVTEKTVKEFKEFLSRWKNKLARPQITEPLIREMQYRAQFLEAVGLGYLELNRAGNTLSGGETQRLRLAAQLGTNLRSICYILDEPTIGLHPSDHQKLLSSLRDLRDKKNTVIVVEHDPDTIRAADYIVDMGPGAGKNGGKIVFSGTLDKIESDPSSITGRYLKKAGVRPKKLRPLAPHGWLHVRNASIHNLKNVSVDIPLGNLVCITGVSGSGKSSLVMDTIYEGLVSRYLFPHAAFKGQENIRRILKVDHNPIGRTPRSIPATYVGLYTYIRKLYAATPEARTRGFSPSHFSFNVSGGRCERCQGQGKIRVAMSFLPEVYNTCEECRGRRFKPEIQKVKYKDRSVADVLEMTVEEALEFFKTIKTISKTLQLLADLGLGYLTLGQPSPTLSGGESQRIKLAAELSKNTNGKTLYVLDEPTTGLHSHDIDYLLETLQRLVDTGNTILVIEHNMEIISQADFIIDLGPGGGPEGGEVIATGTPDNIMRHAEVSKTARHLRQFLNPEP